MPEIPFFSGVFDRLDDWRNEVVEDKLMGHGIRTLYDLASFGGRITPTGGGDPITGFLLNSMNADDAKAASAAGLKGKDWVDAAYGTQPWQRAIVSGAIDPMNLVGMGIPGAALKSLPAASKLAPVLQAANVVDKAPGAITKPFLDIAGKGAGGLLKGTAEALQPAGQAYARKFPNAAEGIQNTMRGWREQALLSPGYHLRNASENILRPALEGDFKTAGEVVKGYATGTNRFDRMASGYGLDVDADVMRAINQDPTGTQNTGSVFRKVDFSPKPKVSRVDVPRGAADGTLLEQTGTTPSGWPKYQGVVMNGDAVQIGDELLWKGGQKGTITGVIDAPGTGPMFTVSQPHLPGRAVSVRPVDVVSHMPGPGMTTPAAAPNIAQRAGNKAAKGMAWAVDTNKDFGMAVEGRARKAAIITEYERSIGAGASHDQAVKDAIDYADKLYFNYADSGPVDDLGRNLFAFHKFGLNNIPAQLRSAGQRPALLNVPGAYYAASDKYNEANGLPSRFHGEMPIGNTGWHVNPLGLSSLGQLAGFATKRTANDDEGTWLGQTAELGQGIGLGLNPFIDALLTVTGQHGRSFAPGFLRASQPVNGILSSVMDRPVDIEGVPKELLGNAQEAITGQRPFPYQEYLLNKRQAELKAFGGDPGDAGHQLGDQMAAEGTAGFVGIPGLKLLTPEEQQIRKNAALAKAMELAGSKTAYRDNPTARVYADLDPRDRQVAMWNELSAAERRRLLRDPEVRDQLLDKLAMQLHNTGSAGKQSPNPFARPTKAATKSRIAAAQERAKR
jgi:hypothetical protein